MLGIVFFYLSSQAAWLEGSTQAISQREASVILGSQARVERRQHLRSVVSPERGNIEPQARKDLRLKYTIRRNQL